MILHHSSCILLSSYARSLSPSASSPQTFSVSQRRSCWNDALSLLIQPSVRAQFSIHSCHILILSLDTASGIPVKELTVWGVGRDCDWYTEIHLQMLTVTRRLRHLPTKTSIHMRAQGSQSRCEICSSDTLLDLCWVSWQPLTSSSGHIVFIT